MALGAYPAISLKEARKARDIAKVQKAAGKDPVQERKSEKLKAARIEGSTFKSIALEWYKKRVPHWSASHAGRMLRQLERDLSPWIGDLPMDQIQPMELLAALQKIDKSHEVHVNSHFHNPT